MSEKSKKEKPEDEEEDEIDLEEGAEDDDDVIDDDLYDYSPSPSGFASLSVSSDPTQLEGEMDIKELQKQSATATHPLTLQTLDGTIKKFSIDPTKPLIELKSRIAELTGVDIDDIKFIIPDFPFLSDGVMISVVNLKPNQRLIMKGSKPTEVTLAEEPKPYGGALDMQMLAAAMGGEYAQMMVKKSKKELQLESWMQLLGESTPPRNFFDNFETVYSPIHPRFFDGQFSDAIASARKQFKILLVYLHYDLSDNTTPFCCGTLPTLTSFIEEQKNLMSWIGVVTENNADRFKTQLGIKNFPVLVFFASIKGSTTMLDMIQGAGLLDVNEVMARLMSVSDNYGPSLQEAKVENQNREMARQVVAEQDLAYEESLAEDAMKEEYLRIQEASRKEKEEKEAKEKEEAEKKQKEEEDLRLAKEEEERKLREEKKKLIPDEPEKGPEATQIAIRMPDGSRVERRFLKTHPLTNLFDYVDSLGKVDTQNYAFVSTVPRAQFERSVGASTFAEKGLHPQALLHVKTL